LRQPRSWQARHITNLGLSRRRIVEITAEREVLRLGEIELRRNGNGIKESVLEKGIERLEHFTRVENARSILSNGLASRGVLEKHGVYFVPSSMDLISQRPDAISLSIHSTNKRMFASKRNNSRGDWIYLLLDSSILWTHPCEFCWTSAASYQILNHTGRRDGLWAFNKMFGNAEHRERWNIPSNQPTDESAEVQVLDNIEPELIVSISVGDWLVKRKIESIMHQVGTVRPVDIIG